MRNHRLGERIRECASGLPRLIVPMRAPRLVHAHVIPEQNYPLRAEMDRQVDCLVSAVAAVPQAGWISLKAHLSGETQRVHLRMIREVRRPAEPPQLVYRVVKRICAAELRALVGGRLLLPPLRVAEVCGAGLVGLASRELETRQKTPRVVDGYDAHILLVVIP